MTSQNEIEIENALRMVWNALRMVWFVIILVTSVLAAVIAAVMTSAHGAVTLVVWSCTTGAFFAAFGAGVKAYNFFHTS